MLPKSVGISWGWSSFLREPTISKIANLRPSTGLLPATAKRSGRIENTKKRIFTEYFKFDFSGIIFIFFQIMRVNAKVTFGTFHRESFGILQRRQPGFRQNAFLSDKRGRPNKMFDRNILTVQEGTLQFVQMFDSLQCYITNISLFLFCRNWPRYVFCTSVFFLYIF